MNVLDSRLWEQKYLDIWSAVHLLNGACFGFAIFFYGLPFKEGIIVFIAFAILWEILEAGHAREPLTNQITDVLSGILGFFSTYWLVPLLAPNLPKQLIYFTVIYLAVWIIAHYGFQSLALHFNKDKDRYKKTFRGAFLIYIVTMTFLFLLRR